MIKNNIRRFKPLKNYHVLQKGPNKGAIHDLSIPVVLRRTTKKPNIKYSFVSRIHFL